MKQFVNRFYFVILLQVCVQFSIKAQWMALPNPSYTLGFSCVNPGSGVYLTLPYADDRSIYASSCVGPTPNSGISGTLWKSTDNLNTKQYLWEWSGGTNCCSVHKVISENDSTFFYTFYNGSYIPYYTKDNFKTITNLFPSPNSGFYGLSAVAHAIAPNFLYTMGQQDSVRIVKVSKTGILQSKYAISTFSISSDELKFMNDTVGFTLGYTASNFSLMKTMNSGASWSAILTETLQTIVDYQIFPSGEIYLLKYNGSVYKSNNAGASFSALTSAPTGTYSCIHFANNLTGFIGGVNGVLLRTTDGGNSWIPEISNTTEKIMDIYNFSHSSYFTDALAKTFRNTQPVGLSWNIKENDALDIFPNPAINELVVEYKANQQKESQLKVCDMTGKTVVEKSFSNKLQLDISDLSSGIYLIQICENSRIVATKKLVITR